MTSTRILRPPRLAPGARVALLSPSGAVLEPDDIDRSAELCRALGLEPVVMPAAARRHGYLAGTDDERLGDLQQALNDASIGAIWCIRGGFGLTRILARIDFTFIPFKGSNPSLTALVAGQVDLTLENQPVVLPHIGAGKLRGLAVGTLERSALLPQLPTMREAGVAGYEMSTAFGVLAPAGTAAPVLERLSREIAGVLKSNDLRESLARQGLEAVGSTPAQYAQHLRDERARYARLIKSAGIRIE